jgi:hypothetical protein
MCSDNSLKCPYVSAEIHLALRKIAFAYRCHGNGTIQQTLSCLEQSLCTGTSSNMAAISLTTTAGLCYCRRAPGCHKTSLPRTWPTSAGSNGTDPSLLIDFPVRPKALGAPHSKRWIDVPLRAPPNDLRIAERATGLMFRVFATGTRLPTLRLHSRGSHQLCMKSPEGGEWQWLR